MGWMKVLMLSVFASVITAGPGCTEETVFGTAECRDLYGGLAGYELCEQTDSSCIFYRSDTPDISCAAICAFSGASCLKAYVEEGGACDPNAAQPCPRVDGYAQLCSLVDGNTCVNVCQGAAFTGGCETDMDCTAPLTCDNDQLLGASTCECGIAGTGGTDGERNVCHMGAEIPCDQPESDAVCECGRPSDGGTGGTGGTRGVFERCQDSTMVYCNNGYDCQGTWAVEDDIFEELYGPSLQECLDTGSCPTTEAEECSEGGTYNAANHEACISGQETSNCEVEDVDGNTSPVFPAECDQICVLGGLGDSCDSTDDCDQNASPELGVFCCLEDAATCGNNLGECVEDCSIYSSGGEVGMAEDDDCQDNNECGAGLFCCLVPNAAGNCDFSLNQSCTCRSNR